MDLEKFKQVFLNEAHSLLTHLDETLIDLEKEPANQQYVAEAFRVLHTLKGTSGMYGFVKVEEVTHQIESLYDIFRNNKQEMPGVLIDLTYNVGDHMRSLLADESFSNEDNILRHSTIMSTIDRVKDELGAIVSNIVQPVNDAMNGMGQHVLSTWNILFYPDEQIVKRAINLVCTFQDLLQLGEYKVNNCPFLKNGEPYWSIFLVTDKTYEEIEDTLLFVMDYCKIAKIAPFNIFDASEFEKRDQSFEARQPVQMAPVMKSTEKELSMEASVLDKTRKDISTDLPKHGITHINVDSHKLDTLMYLVSELVTSKSELLLVLKQNSLSKAMDTAEKIEKLSKMFSDNVLEIRLVSLHEMLSRFKRLVRDLAKQLGKSVSFITIGEETELDKNIIDKIGEPIMHLVRNCIDHGIETPEKRLADGKSATGTITFEAVKTGNNVFISIGDDGNGIDIDYVYNKAVEQGFIPAGTNLTEKEIYDLIFLPGFSTAQSLSNISGRGVGMDIVLRKIKDIRGEITVLSKKGKGTTFILKLQQTISIVDTLLVESGTSTYAIPIEDIESCVLELSDAFTKKTNRLVRYNREMIPYIALSGKKNDTKQDTNDTRKMVVITKSDRKYAVVVDTIIGEYQAVVKPLGKTFSNLRYLSGASLLGDGGIALLLDTDKLWYEIIN